jgi:hypothetical protein
MYKETINRLKRDLEKRLLEILKEADLRKDFKEKILNLEFGSIHYQTYTTKVKGKEYRYHHLSANWKNPDNNRWQTVGLKNLRRKPEWFDTLPVIYNTLKRVDELLKNLEVIGLE